MSPILPAVPPASQRESLAGIRPRPVKADLRPQPCEIQLRTVAAEAIRLVTSQKAAATDIGIHEGRLSHKLRDGSLTLAQLETLGPKYAAALGRELTVTYGEALESPKAYARRLCDAMQAIVNELRQFIDNAA